MLAKILKNETTMSVAPYVVPDLGGSAMTIGVTDFKFPSMTIEVKQAEAAGLTTVAGAPDIEEILRNAHAEAEQIIADATAKSAAIEQAAIEQGLAAARATIDQEIGAAADEMRQQLAETIENVSNLSREIAVRAEKEIVQLALEIARKVVAHEVKIDREIALTLARVSLGRLHNRATAFVHLHPDDFAYVAAHREKLGFHGALELVEDRSVDLGGCLIRTENGDIDARIESQFEEISRGLIG